MSVPLIASAAPVTVYVPVPPVPVTGAVIVYPVVPKVIPTLIIPLVTPETVSIPDPATILPVNTAVIPKVSPCRYTILVSIGVETTCVVPVLVV